MLPVSAPGREEGPAGAVPAAPRPWRSPVQFIAFGFGTGLAPRAPGTVGTLVAVPLYYCMVDFGLPLYSALVLAGALFGVWLCGAASRQLGGHDHPGIVWDEFVGYWVTMWALPTEGAWVVAGFIVFRVFDIVKPWPVWLVDRRVGGGAGIMLDDIIAGVMACLTLHIARWLM